jgi:hypothetical protein
MRRCEVCTNVTDLIKTEEVDRHVEVTRCSSCRYADRLPWDVLVGLLLGSGLQGASRYSQMIFSTCDYFDRSEQELWAEVEQAQHQYINAEFNSNEMEETHG